jgi:FkbH-like protein
MADQNKSFTIALAATFTAEPVEPSINFWIEELGLPAKLQFAPYNQIFQQLLDPSSLLARNEGGFNVLLIRSFDWLPQSQSHKTLEIDSAIVADLERKALELVKASTEFVRRSTSQLVVMFCPNPPQNVATAAAREFFERLESDVSSELAALPGVEVVLPAQLMTTYPVTNYYDTQGDRNGHVPYRSEFFAAIGTSICRKIFRSRSTPYKVIAVDCDETLWKGVCAEDGPSAVIIDAPRRMFQQWLLAQREAGMLLCLSSKNNPEDVKQVLERPDMSLRQEHVAAARINWNPKSENLQVLASELNLGLNSFVFIDDNPLECEEVRRNCPEVLTLQLPTAANEMPAFLNSLWALDKSRATKEDALRATFQASDAERNAAQNALGLREFLLTLELKVEISEMKPDELSRVAQLFERTNQFNLTSRRRSEAELNRLCTSGELQFLVTKVADRFGDYGLVGVIAFGEKENELVVDSFMLSCRALGRGVEHRMLSHLGKIAVERNLERIALPLIRTARNQPALDFLDSVRQENALEQNGELLYQFYPAYAAAVRHQALGERPLMKNNGGARSNGHQQTPEPLQHSALSQSQQAEIFAKIAEQFRHIDQIVTAIYERQRNKHVAVSSVRVLEGPIEEQLAQIWQETIGIDAVSREDNFFDVGGQSLSAVMMGFKIRQTFGIDFSLPMLMQFPILHAQAEKIQELLLEQAAPNQLNELLQEFN